MDTHAPIGPPPGEAILECAKAALQGHARGNGDGISVLSSRDSRTLYGCAKDEDEAGHEPLSQAIDTVIKTGRARKAKRKALESAEQAELSKAAPKMLCVGPVPYSPLIFTNALNILVLQATAIDKFIRHRSILMMCFVSRNPHTSPTLCSQWYPHPRVASSRLGCPETSLLKACADKVKN